MIEVEEPEIPAEEVAEEVQALDAESDVETLALSQERQSFSPADFL